MKTIIDYEIKYSRQQCSCSGARIVVDINSGIGCNLFFKPKFCVIRRNEACTI